MGIGSGYVLDPEATELFRRAMGDTHQVRPGTMRTFLPGAVPGDAADALRHRVLSTGRIVEDKQPRLTRLLGWRARDVAIETRLPSAATRLDRLFEKQLNVLLVGDGAEPTAVGAVAPAIQRTPGLVVKAADLQLLRLLRDELGEPELTPNRLREFIAFARLGQREHVNRQALSQRLAELEERNAELQRSLDEVSEQLDDETLELAEARAELVKEAATNRHLRGLLRKAQRWEDAWSHPAHSEADELPDSFDDVLTGIAELRHVIFTGDPAHALDLEENDRMGIWAGRTWDALLALEDYAKASAEGRCNRDVDGYLRNLPDDCRGYPAHQHARDETADVRNNVRLAGIRTFPVPIEVDPSGRVFMGAHFRIAKFGMVSPRMHYFDATRRTGKIYVGYIGAHLKSRMTN
ncbi:hypothetical protein [Saccharopolyspora thermophila]|uniref:Uncharacterized protein n=1 Tax=Saccharopolyspora thermophila TaxID=89367 RepID=A0ABN1CJ04_9PSEU